MRFLLRLYWLQQLKIVDRRLVDFAEYWEKVAAASKVGIYYVLTKPFLLQHSALLAKRQRLMGFLYPLPHARILRKV